MSDPAPEQRLKLEGVRKTFSQGGRKLTVLRDISFEVDAGELVVTVDRDFVLDLGTRFAQSLYDFGFRIGGGDFAVSAELDDGRVASMTLDGDDPGSGVERFTFTIEFAPSAGVVIEPPPDAVPFP